MWTRDTPPSSRRRRWPALAAISLLLGTMVLGGQVWRTRDAAGVAEAAVAAGPAASAAPPGIAFRPDGHASTAKAAPTALPPVTPATPARQGLDKALLASIEKQWCTHYAEADAQFRQALEQPSGGGLADMDMAAIDRRVDALRSMPTQQAREAVRARVLARWIGALDRAGDSRSRAVAAYLAESSFDEGWDLRQARLAAAQRQALQTSDPMEAALWASGAMQCVDKRDCRAAARQRWQAVEPGNLMAWLRGPLDGITTTESQWQGIAQAQHARSYAAVLQARLLELLPLADAGLEREEALAVVERVSDQWNDQTARFHLLQDCRSPADVPRRRDVCLKAAELLWNDPQPSMLGRIQLMALVDQLGARDPAVWSGREAALKSGFTPALGKLMGEVEFGQDGRELQGCSAHPAREERLKALVGGGRLKVLEQVAARRSTGRP